MSNDANQEFRFRISLRELLIALLVLGAGFGVLGRLFRQNPQTFAMVIGVLSSIAPYLLAVGTIIWIGVNEALLIDNVDLQPHLNENRIVR